MSIDQVLAALKGVKAAGEHQWQALCPAHEDREASLSVKQADGEKVLLYCHAGCAVDAICKAAGLEVKDLFPESTAKVAKPRTPAKAKSKTIPYEVRDGSGTLIAVHERHESDHGKKFIWKQANGDLGLGGLRLRDLPLYGTEHLHRPSPGAAVVLCEGEKATDSLRERGIEALGTVTGAQETPSREVVSVLLPFTTYLWADNDTPGRKHMTSVGSILNRLGHKDLWVVNWSDAPEKGDAADFRGDAGELLQAATRFEPPEAVEAGSLLDDVSSFIRRFIIVDDDALVVLPLWVCHTWVLGAFDFTPYLHIQSPEKRCGKSRVLEVLNLLVKDPWLTFSTSAAAIMRKVESDQPSLLLDEYDGTFGADPESTRRIFALLNSGYVRSGKATVCEKADGTFAVRDFATFCAKAFAGIGQLPDTLADRCLVVMMRRKKRTERVERFRERMARGEAMPFVERLSAWAPGVIDDLRRAEPDVPDALRDRQADVSEPLLAIADLAGGQWPDRARRALLGLCGQESEDGPGVQLLRDTRTVFGDRGRMFTQDLVGQLAAMEESPWGTLHKGKPLDQRGLAHRLRAFGIQSRNIREGERTAKGYHREQFEDAWIRYLPPVPPFANVTTSQLNADGPFGDFLSVTSGADVTDEKPRKPNTDGPCDGVTDKTPGEGSETDTPGVEAEPPVASERQSDALSTPEQPERCFCCGGTDFWRLQREGSPWACRTCHPPAKGLDVETTPECSQEVALIDRRTT